MPTSPKALQPTVDISLRDGSRASLRPVRPGDTALIKEGLAHMSLESRAARFGTGIDHLSDTELEYLTNIDLVDHVAWGALIDGEPAGTGRYIRPAGAGEAEIAVAVVDPYQGRGLGRQLFNALVASARHNGIDSLYFSVQPRNRKVIDMLSGVELEIDEGGEVIIGRLNVRDLKPQANDDGLVDLLEWYQANG